MTKKQSKKQSKIGRPQPEANLPQADEAPRHVDQRDVFKRMCLRVLTDPAATARERFEAMRMYSTFADASEPEQDRGFEADLRVMSDEAIDDLLGIIIQPINRRRGRNLTRTQIRDDDADSGQLAARKQQ
jgi:hypothetical protein